MLVLLCAHAGYQDPVRFLARVTSKGADWIELERPLPVKVEGAWVPEIHKWAPMIDGNCCLEGLTIEFPYTQYAGHFLVSAARLAAVAWQARSKGGRTMAARCM